MHPPFVHLTIGEMEEDSTFLDLDNNGLNMNPYYVVGLTFASNYNKLVVQFYEPFLLESLGSFLERWPDGHEA
jgi:hypothetical protein